MLYAKDSVNSNMAKTKKSYFKGSLNFFKTKIRTTMPKIVKIQQY